MSALTPEAIAGIVIGSIGLLGLTGYGLSGSSGSSNKNPQADDEAVSDNEVPRLSERLSGVPNMGDYPEYSGVKGRNPMNTNNVEINTDKNE